MPLRRLGDGSFLNEETGELSGYNAAAEAAGRRISAQMGHVQAQKAVLNKGSQHTPGVVASNPADTVTKQIIRPDPRPLAVNPYELGVGSIIPPMSDNVKRIALTGAIVVAALGAVWLNNKFKAKASTKHSRK